MVEERHGSVAVDHGVRGNVDEPGMRRGKVSRGGLVPRDPHDLRPRADAHGATAGALLSRRVAKVVRDRQVQRARVVDRRRLAMLLRFRIVRIAALLELEAIQCGKGIHSAALFLAVTVASHSAGQPVKKAIGRPSTLATSTAPLWRGCFHSVVRPGIAAISAALWCKSMATSPA